MVNEGKVAIKWRNQNGETTSENVGYIRYNVNDGTSDTATANTTLDTFVRAVTELTTNSYVTSEITYTYDLETILDES